MVAAGAGVLAVGVGAFVAYGALGPTGTPRQQLRTWVEASQFGQTVGTLEGDADLVSALGLVDGVLRHSVPTTTTTEPGGGGIFG